MENWLLTYLNEHLEFPTFKDAVKVMSDKVSADIKAERLTWQLLETMIWIEPRDRSAPIMFYTARDIAAEQGWYDEWEKLNENPECSQSGSGLV